MDIHQLISIIKNKIEKNIIVQEMSVNDKTYLHKNHLSHQEGKFHIQLIIKSSELLKYNKIQATKKIYNILDDEIKKYIHSIQLLIN
tara:strand:+ start:862 stop:1122 length:261 start_codon:yes stop_codon:yes gene_type:complete